MPGTTRESAGSSGGFAGSVRRVVPVVRRARPRMAAAPSMLPDVTTLQEPLARVLGPKTGKALLESLSLHTVGDLIRHYPRRFRSEERRVGKECKPRLSVFH